VIFQRLGSTGYYLTMSLNGGADVVLNRPYTASPFELQAAGNQRLRLGGSEFPKHAGPTNRYWYEVLMYDGLTTGSAQIPNNPAANRTLITNYLKDKWGIE